MFQDRPGSGEDFVAIHRDAVGVKEELNPQLRSLMAMAITYLPKDFRFVRVITATREIVAGVRFILLIDALDNNRSDIVCAVQVFEKPWMVTEYGSKFRILEYSNCTESGDEFRVDPTAIAAAENNTKLNPIFQRRPFATDRMSQQRLSDLESQIVLDQSTPDQMAQVSQTNLNQQNYEEQSKPQVVEPSTQIQSINAVHHEVPSRPSVNLPEDFQNQIQAALQNIFNTNPEIRAAVEEISNSPNANEVQQKYENVLERLVQVVVARIFANPDTMSESFTFQIPIVLNNPTKRIKSAVVYIKKEVQATNADSSSSTQSTVPYEETSSFEPTQKLESELRVARSISAITRSPELDVVEIKDFIANQILDPLVKQCKDLRESKTNSCFKDRTKVSSQLILKLATLSKS